MLCLQCFHENVVKSKVKLRQFQIDQKNLVIRNPENPPKKIVTLEKVSK